jgi:hypothetical protein
MFGKARLPAFAFLLFNKSFLGSFNMGKDEKGGGGKGK